MTSPLPRLSVVTFTDGPVPVVAAALRRVREVADEIVVAVDDRVDPASFGPLLAVADRVIRAEFVYPLEANLAWLHDQATGDWVLRLDGDDLVSDELCHFLTTPGWDDGITHAYLQYRWIWDSPARMLDQAPWWPDPVLRLIRRVPGIVSFPTGAHEVAMVGGHGRIVDVPLYHLDLVMTDPTARARKAAAYERDTPGRRTDRGWAVSTTYYLPERLAPAPRTAPVPALDRTTIEAVLSATDASAAPPGGWPQPDPEAPVVTAASRRAPAPAPIESRVRLLAHDPVTVRPGRPTIVTAAVTNRSARTWQPGEEPPTRLGGRLLTVEGLAVGGELRSELTGPVSPGQEALVRIAIPPVLPDGVQRLEVGVVQDGVAWHDGRATVGIRTQAGRRVLLVTGSTATPHLGHDLITCELLAALARDTPDVVPVLVAHPAGDLAERFGCQVVASPASLPLPDTGRLADPSRASRELVAQARLVAKGEPASDQAVADVLAPFVDADALVVSTGGGLASHHTAILTETATTVAIARAFDLEVLVEGASIGPLEQRREQAAVTTILEGAARVAVRDPASADLAQRLGKTAAPLLIADPSTAAMDPLSGTAEAGRWLDDHGIPPERDYAVISLRGDEDRPEHLAAVRAALDALPPGAAAVYLPHRTGQGDDDRSLVAHDAWCRSHLAVWDPALPDHAAVALIAGAIVTVGSRFHLTALASAAGVPAVALAGSSYDRRRLRSHRDRPGVQVVERNDAPAVGKAVADLLAADRPEPGSRWDPTEFTTALAAVLPPVPRLS